MKNYAKLSARNALTGNYTDPAFFVMIMLVTVLSLVLLNQLVADKKSEISLIVFVASIAIFAVSMNTVKFIMSARLLQISENFSDKSKLPVVKIIKGSCLSLCIGALRLLHFFAFMFLPFLFSLFVYLRLRSNSVSVISLVINAAGIAVIFVLSLIFYGVSVQKFSKATYYFAENPSVSLKSAIKLSVENTRGDLLKIFAFKCSFFPWFMSGILLLPLMFVLPYYEESFIFYCMYGRK